MTENPDEGMKAYTREAAKTGYGHSRFYKLADRLNAAKSDLNSIIGYSCSFKHASREGQMAMIAHEIAIEKIMYVALNSRNVWVMNKEGCCETSVTSLPGRDMDSMNGIEYRSLDDLTLYQDGIVFAIDLCPSAVAKEMNIAGYNRHIKQMRHKMDSLSEVFGEKDIGALCFMPFQMNRARMRQRMHNAIPAMSFIDLGYNEKMIDRGIYRHSSSDHR
jgi:hypothetical protein